MKKTLIAFSLSLAFATTANATVTLYDKDGSKLNLNGYAYLELNKTTDNRYNLSNGGAKARFDFTQKINDDLSALGYTELSFSNSKFEDPVNTKKLYAGLSSQKIGTLTFGYQKTAANEFTGIGDPTWNGLGINSFYNVYDEHQQLSSVRTSGRKVVKFKSAKFNGFTGTVSYTLPNKATKTIKDDKTKKDVANPYTNDFQVALKYNNTFGDVELQVATLYDNAHFKYRPQETDPYRVYHQTYYGLGSQVSYKDFTLGVAYAHNKADNVKHKDGSTYSYKFNGYQVGTSYQVSEPFDVYASYTQFLVNYGNKKGHITGASVGFNYLVSKKLYTYAEYSTDKSSKPGEKRFHGYYVGAYLPF